MADRETATPPPNEPSAIHKFWQHEISAATKREKDWREEGRRILRVYDGQKAATNDTIVASEAVPYNILYSNTETLLPALYSAQPRPVVVRRFKDADPLGKLAAQTGQRGLEFLIDTNIEGYETFDDMMASVTLDGLLPGRAITRVKYDATIGELSDTQEEQAPTPYTKVELVCVETCSWDGVLMGYAKKWSKVPWVAYREYIDKAEAIRLFGKAKAEKLTYIVDAYDDRDRGESRGNEERDTGERKSTMIWQIWDKEERDDGAKKVRYLSEQYLAGYLDVQDDPLQLTGFFPCPKPLQFVAKTNTMLPSPLYTLYENQAEELNKLTRRINHIVEAIKARGIYDSTLGETVETLFQAAENQLVPTDINATLLAGGGIEKSIWFAPVDKLIVVLTELYRARESCKRVIYEITGIADIIRGSSVASETLGAQQIKERWGTMRLKRMQKEVQRYTRDLLRMMLEVAAMKFSEETWAKMTGLPFLTTEKYRQLQQIAQAAQQQMTQMPNMAQNPQAMQQMQQLQQQLQTPQWSQVLAMLRDDTQRAYRIDIETNSTIEPEAVEDQKQISEMIGAMGQFLNGVGPLIEKGAMPFGVAQNMLLAISRRFRFGTEIEDDIKQMQAPQPKDDGKAGAAQEAQAKMQLEQQRLQMDAQGKQAEMQHAQQLEAAKQQRDQTDSAQKMQLEMAKIQATRETETMRIEAEKQAQLATLNTERQTEKMKAQTQQETELKKAALVAATQIEIANIKAMQDAAAVMQASAAEGEQTAQTADMMAKILERQERLLVSIMAPKTIERDQNGRALRILPQAIAS